MTTRLRRRPLRPTLLAASTRTAPARASPPDASLSPPPPRASRTPARDPSLESLTATTRHRSSRSTNRRARQTTTTTTTRLRRITRRIGASSCASFSTPTTRRSSFPSRARDEPNPKPKPTSRSSSSSSSSSSSVSSAPPPRAGQSLPSRASERARRFINQKRIFNTVYTYQRYRRPTPRPFPPFPFRRFPLARRPRARSTGGASRSPSARDNARVVFVTLRARVRFPSPRRRRRPATERSFGQKRVDETRFIPFSRFFAHLAHRARARGSSADARASERAEKT